MFPTCVLLETANQIHLNYSSRCNLTIRIENNLISGISYLSVKKMLFASTYSAAKKVMTVCVDFVEYGNTRKSLWHYLRLLAVAFSIMIVISLLVLSSFFLSTKLPALWDTEYRMQKRHLACCFYFSILIRCVRNASQYIQAINTCMYICKFQMSWSYFPCVVFGYYCAL